METIDVTLIEPRKKHPTIFFKFDSLPVNETLVIENDHDPKPLYYQLVAERGQIFTWEYLENGPERWVVKITKTKADDDGEKVGEMVAKDFRKAQVFEKFGIDFCCGGKKSLRKACEESNANITEVKAELEKLDKQSTESAKKETELSQKELVALIVNKHHSYVKESNPFLRQFTNKIATVHGDRHPELIEIKSLFEDIANELDNHMFKEEQILFPYIEELENAENEKRAAQPAPFGTVENPINMMESEHDTAGEILRKIKSLSNDYTPPADACNSYRITYAKLKEYENDLHIHIHLENNILFPRAIAMEKK